MKQVIAKRKDVAFYMKYFPLPMHKQAYGDAKAIACSKDPLKMLDKAFAREKLPKATCKTTVVDDDMELGKSLGINATPAIIFPNGIVVTGSPDAANLIKMIDKNQ